MSNFDPGEFVVNAGDFRAVVRLQRNQNSIPSITFSYRIVSDPSNLDGLRRVQEQGGMGYVWESVATVGWSVQRLSDMQNLYLRVRRRARSLPRGEVVEAWGACLDLSPRVLRTKLDTKGREYKAADWVEDRLAAVDALATANRRHPPEYRVLPARYFELWA